MPAVAAPPDTATAAAAAVAVVFVRLPTPGRVKTRLAAGVGPEQAAAFYKLCAERTAAEVARCRAVDGVVFCAGAGDVAGVASWLQAAGTPLPVQPQMQEADLGQRMLAALTAAVQQPWRCTHDGADARTTSRGSDAPREQQEQQQQEQQPGQEQQEQQGQQGQELQEQQQQQQPRHCYQAAIVVGSDIPDLSADVLARAVAALLGDATGSTSTANGPPGSSSHQQQRQEQAPDLVLGPAVDGGFYLLGLRTAALLRPDVQAGAVFEGVTWSCSSVLERTLAAATKLGLRCAPLDRLPLLRDVDTVQDAAAWLAVHDAAAAHDSSSLAPLVQLVRQLVGGHEPEQPSGRPL